MSTYPAQPAPEQNLGDVLLPGAAARLAEGPTELLESARRD